MKATTLAARFDGERIQLDEPFMLPADARLLVTVLPEAPRDDNRFGVECEKLDPTEEQAFADAGLNADLSEWPAY